MLQFETEGIIKDLRLTKAPESSLEVTFDSGVKLEQGNELTPTQVQNQPIVDWDADTESLYTLAFVDPDAPSRAEPTFGQILHWLVVNIPGKNIAAGEEFAEYIGSGPPQGTGLHRYIYLVYKQTSALSLDIPKTSKYSREGRRGFKIADFVAQNKLGDPIAGNFYQAQYDEYVPKLHAQLSAGAPPPPSN